jgi:hypothetical protein
MGVNMGQQLAYMAQMRDLRNRADELVVADTPRDLNLTKIEV